MSEYKLMIPSMEYDKEIQAYRQEFVEKGGSMDGCLNLRQLETQAWLDKLSSIALPENLPEGWVSQTQFIYVRKCDRKVGGVIQIRHFFNERLAQFGGHIGYSVCHSERRKGIAKQMLHDVMPFCLQLGLERVLITCLTDNEGSRKTILANGGVYESTVFCEEDGVNLERYWIDVLPQTYVVPETGCAKQFGSESHAEKQPGSESEAEKQSVSESDAGIYLRKARPDDLEKIWHNCWYSEDVERFTLRKKTESLEEAQQRLADTMEFQKKYSSYFVCLKDTDEPIGFAGIRLREGHSYATNLLQAPGIAAADSTVPAVSSDSANPKISGGVVYDDCGIAIGDRWQGKGYGKQVVEALEKLAFDQLCADKFVYSAMTQNQRSRNLAQSMGFAYCGSTDHVRVRDSFPYVEDSYVKTAEAYERLQAEKCQQAGKCKQAGMKNEG